MELRQLEHFAAVAQHASFTRAALEVHLAQSSLSSSIAQLERELGTPLFERTTRSVTLTVAGRALLPAAARVLEEARAAREAVAAVSGVVRGRLAVGTIQVLTWVDLPAALRRLLRAHPGVEVSLLEAPVDELIDALVAGDLDLAYVARDASALPDAVVAVASREEELVVVAAPDHPLADQHEVLLSSLGSESFIGFHARSGLSTVVERLCADAGLERRITMRVSQLDLLLSLVRSHLGLAIVPAPIADRTDLARLRIADPHAHRTVALVARTRLSNPAAQVLLDDLHGSA